ncbi:2291_t:CDS:2, partial [Paraglomus occultum]
SKKGLSVAEKRKRLEDLFHERKEFFQLKELEKIAPKEKGIVSQTVKDILQSLVDDNLVQCEKIGTSNYYWAFPSSALQSRRTKIDDLTNELKKLKEKNADLTASIENASNGREESDERTTLLGQLAEAENLRKQNLEELKRYKECDPILLEAKEKASAIALESANRWTENIFLLQSYCVNKCNVERADFNRQFGIPEDFDTL